LFLLVANKLLARRKNKKRIKFFLIVVSFQMFYNPLIAFKHESMSISVHY